MHKSLFSYPTAKHDRRHGPSGYEAYQSYKPWLRDEFTFRCVFCLTRETWIHRGHQGFSVEHFKPRHNHPALVNDYDNLLYSCCACNSAKAGSEVSFDPCAESFNELLEMMPNGEFRPKNDDGRLMVAIFDLNAPGIVTFRKTLIDSMVILASKPDPTSIRALELWLRWPNDLPDLRNLQPRENHKPNGIRDSYFELHRQNRLPSRMEFR